MRVWMLRSEPIFNTARSSARIRAWTGLRQRAAMARSAPMPWGQR